MAECRDSASEDGTRPALIVSLLHLTSTDEARCMTRRSGVGRARRGGPRDPGAAAGEECGGGGGREGLGQGEGEEPAASESTDVGSTTLKDLESQDSLTYSVSLSSQSGNGAVPSRCFT